jgi:hypothetical protein
MKKKTIKFNQEIEDRIETQIIVDTYDESEAAMGWHCYLQDTITFPFNAKCIKKVSTSPLLLSEDVEVIAMDEAENCEHEMLVEVKWRGESICVPLEQLDGVGVDDKTKQALNDWAYWVDQGYSF